MLGNALTQVLFVGAGGLGAPELMIILLLAVLLFGANKLPKLARSSGQALGEFQKGREQVETELEEIRGQTDVDPDELVDADELVDSDLGSDSGSSTSSE